MPSLLSPARRGRRSTAAICLVPLGLALVAGCGQSPGGDGGESGTRVVASTTVVADLVRNVAGDRASVDGVLPENADPHDYEPRPSDALSLTDADLIVGSGGDVDLWLVELVESSGSGAPEVELIDSVSTMNAEGEVDPHWWQDPQDAVSAVEAIRDALIEADPDGRADYEANAEDYIARIESVDRDVANCIETVPVAQRKLVTSHDALGYYAERYGIDVVGSTIPALTTQAQPSAGETAELVDLIEREDVRAVFPEVGVSAQLEDSIAEESGAEVGGELYADTLGPPGSGADTYLGMITTNTATMVDGFTGGDSSCDSSAGA